MPIDSTISKAKAAAAEGNAWRAKEILYSSIPNYGYSKELFRELSTLLLQTGDNLEAGKYLLLCADSPTDQERIAIELFLGRHKRLDGPAFLSLFPAKIRPAMLAQCPEQLRDHLLQFDLSSKLTEPPSHCGVSQLGDAIALLGCAVFTVFVLGLIAIGLYTIASWVQ